MKRLILWLLQSFFYLVPIMVSVVGAYVIAHFISFYPGVFIVLWIIVVAYVYIRYSKWV